MESTGREIGPPRMTAFRAVPDQAVWPSAERLGIQRMRMSASNGGVSAGIAQSDFLRRCFAQLTKFIP